MKISNICKEEEKKKLPQMKIERERNHKVRAKRVWERDRVELQE